MERKYVNEERYQKVIHVLKILRIILIVVGVCMIIGGIVLFIFGFKNFSQQSSSTNGNGYMDEYGFNIGGSSNSSSFNSDSFDVLKIMGGALLTSLGFMSTFVGAVVLSIIIHRRSIMGFAVSQTKPIVEEGYQAYKPLIKEVAKDIKEEVGSTNVGEKMVDPDKDHKFCKYCGNILDNDAAFCEYCGKKLN